MKNWEQWPGAAMLILLGACLVVEVTYGATLDRQQTLFESYPLHGTAPCMGRGRTWTVKLATPQPDANYLVIVAIRDNAEIATFVTDITPTGFKLTCVGANGWLDWAVTR